MYFFEKSSQFCDSAQKMLNFGLHYSSSLSWFKYSFDIVDYTIIIVITITDVTFSVIIIVFLYWVSFELTIIQKFVRDT